MRILKPVGEKLTINDIEYNLFFNINVVDELQEHYDMPMADILNSILSDPDENGTRFTTKETFSKVVFILKALINEDVRVKNNKALLSGDEQLQEVAEGEIREVLTSGAIFQVIKLLLDSFNKTLPKSENEDPNAKSGQVKK